MKNTDGLRLVDVSTKQSKGNSGTVKYRLYDIYDNIELLGEFDTMSGVREACKQRDLDTDCEWTPELWKYDSSCHKYRIRYHWSY